MDDPTRPTPRAMACRPLDDAPETHQDSPNALPTLTASCAPGERRLDRRSTLLPAVVDVEVAAERAALLGDLLLDVPDPGHLVQ
jgi:hypothetical protein